MDWYSLNKGIKQNNPSVEINSSDNCSSANKNEVILSRTSTEDFSSKNKYIVEFVEETVKFKNKAKTCNADLYCDLCEIGALEIALEGLDGITIEGLWTRIANALEDTYIGNKLKSYLWESIRYRNEIDFYELENPRPNLIIHDRYQNIDDELGLVLDIKFPDIYEYCPVNDKQNGIVGSCKDYYSRKLISNEVRDLNWYEVVEKYGNKLVIVASQNLRKHSLFTDLCDPLVELMDSQYCVLERIGRSRKQGEVTQGKMSLQCTAKDPKTLFYYRKVLEEKLLITKQTFVMKSNNLNVNGNVLHLLKFYNERKAKAQVLTERIVNILKEKPNYRMDYVELRKLFSNNEEISKLMKLPIFQKFVRTDVPLRYRDFYPDAPKYEWKLKKKDKEKTVRAIELIDPQLNVASCWNEEDVSDLSSDDEALSEISLTDSTLSQVFKIVFDSASKGITIKDIQYLTNLDFYSVRAIVRILVKRKAVQTFKIDREKQRIVKYYVKNSTNREPMKEQINGNKELLKQSNQHISSLLGIDEYHLESSPTLSTENEFENSLKAFVNISNNTGILVRNLRKGLNYHKTNNKRLNCLQAESGSLDSFEQPKPEEHRNNTNSLETYKNLLQIESNLCKNSFSFSPCRQKSTINFFPQGTSRTFNQVCSKIIKNVNSVKLSDNKKVEVKINRPPKPPQPVPEKILNIFKKLFSENIKNSSSKNIKEDISQLLKQFSEFIQFAGTCSLSEIEYKLKMNVEEHFQYNFYQLNPDISIINFPRLHSINDFEISTTLPKKRKSFDSDPLATNKRLKIDKPLDGSDTPHTEKVEECNITITKVDEGEKNTRSAMDFRLMGLNPVFLKKTMDKENIEVSYYASTLPKKFATKDSKYKAEYGSTLKKSVRANAIIEKVREEMVFPELFKLCNLMHKIEEEKGYKTKIDKKTMERLIGRLVAQGFLKVVKVVAKMENIFQIKYIICHPSVDIDHYMIMSAIEQLKIKLSVTKSIKEDKKKQNVRNALLNSDTVNMSVGELKSLTTGQWPTLKYSRYMGKTYGYCPKFVRAKVLHKFLFNMIYGERKNLSNDIRRVLFEAKVLMDEESIRELPPLYGEEVCSEMFVSPLPQHPEWPQGWALVCDIILRLPVSLFFKIVNVSYVIPNIDHYLKHPVRQHLPIKFLPLNILNGMMFKRKYLFSFHEALVLLCYMGLLQFGPQKMREKDQMFVYLNRRTSLLDTDMSKPGYHQIEDREYKQMRFVFNNISDVDSYWHHLWTITMHTQLGQRYALLGEIIQIDNVHFKPSMVKALYPKTPTMAIENDDGEVPGDRKGSAGLDSSLWPHLKRNWSWSKQKKDFDEISPSMRLTGVRKRRIDEINVKPVKYADLQKMQSTSKKNISLPTADNKTLSKTHKVIKYTHQKRKRASNKELREILPRRHMKKARRNISVDDIDRKILKKIKQSRSVWKKSEDELLLILRTTSLYFCEQYRNRVVSYHVIRDVLHKFSSISVSKTAQACHRRIMWLHRDEIVARVIEAQLTLMKNSPFIKKVFSPFRKRVSKNTIDQKEYYSAFVALASYLFFHQQKFDYSKDEDRFFFKGPIVDHLTSDKAASLMNIDFSKDIQYSKPCYFEPTNETEILTETLKTIVHSSLNCKAEKIGWSFQMFQVYQRYPDPLLRKAVTDLRDSEMISSKKNVKKKEKRSFITSASFQFNFRYTFLQNTAKFSKDAYPESASAFQDMCNYKNMTEHAKESGFLIKDFTIGNILGFVELIMTAKVTVFLKIPNEPLALNPNISDHTELIKVLAIRYKRLLTMINDGSYYKDVEQSCELSPDQKSEPNESSCTPATSATPAVPLPSVQTFTLSSRVLNSVAIRTPSCHSTSTKSAVDDMIASVINNVYENLQRDGEFDCEEEMNDEEEDENIDETVPEESITEEESPTDSPLFDVKGWLWSHTTLPIGGEVQKSKSNNDSCQNVNQPARLKHVEYSGFKSRCEILSQSHTLPLQYDANLEISETSANENVLDDQVSSPNAPKETPKQTTEVYKQFPKNNKEVSSWSLSTIMRKIAEDNSDEDSLIPGPTKLVYLLKKGLFPDDNDEYLDKLDQHYIINCPEANLHIEKESELRKYYHEEFPKKCDELINKIRRSAILPKFTYDEAIMKAKMYEKGHDSDLETIVDLINYVKDKNVLGASMKEIKENFSIVIEKSKLLMIMRTLIECGIFFMTGVTLLKCVHSDYRTPWICKSFALKKDDSFKKSMDMEIQILPWTRVNGSLNLKILENWLHLGLTSCLTHPLINIDRLTKELIYLKHVEVYHLVNYLQDLECVKLVAYEYQKSTLWSNFDEPQKVPATEFHDFKEICVEVNPMAVTTLGMFMKIKSSLKSERIV